MRYLFVRYLSIAIPLALLAACSSEPRELSANDRAVVYVVSKNGIDAAEDAAEEHCAEYGRSAHLRNVAKYGEDRHVFFDCV
ncbi:MAG: hypothetical protein AB7P52_09810 [Alphaproteobacteria bacterium]